MRARDGIIGVGLGLLALCGCQDPVTEVVVVLDTDLPLPIQADSLEIKLTTPTGTQTFGQPIPKFPATLTVTPNDAGEPFSVSATLMRCNPAELTLVERTVSGIRFVHGETRAVVLTLLRACACEGTSCPDPRGVPECADVTAPTLSIDSGQALPLPVSLPAARHDGGPGCFGQPHDAGFDQRPAPFVDAATETLIDAPVEMTAERAPDVAAEASSDAGDAADASDGGDGAAEASSDAGDAADARDGGVDSPPDV